MGESDSGSESGCVGGRDSGGSVETGSVGGSDSGGVGGSDLGGVGGRDSGSAGAGSVSAVGTGRGREELNNGELVTCLYFICGLSLVGCNSISRTISSLPSSPGIIGGGVAGTVGGGKSGRLERDSEEFLKLSRTLVLFSVSFDWIKSGRGLFIAPSRSTVFCFHSSFCWYASTEECCSAE